jgi:signal transduction histidine kinase
LLVILGLLGTIGGTWWSTQRTERQELEDLESRGELLVFQTRDLLDSVAMQLVASGSLFRASAHVSPEEFRTFASDIGLMPGTLGIGYVPMVADRDLDTWLEQIRLELPGFEVFELGYDDRPVPLRDRELRFPLLYFEPVGFISALAGLDIGSRDDWRDELLDGFRSDGLTMTTFVELGLPAPLDDEDQFILGWPIADPATGIVSELVVSVLDLSVMVEQNISEEVTRGIDWSVVDVTGVADLGDPGDGWRATIDFGGRTWWVTVSHQGGSGGVFRDTAVYPFVGGLVVTILLALLGSLLTGRLGSRRDLETLEALNDGKDEFLAAVSHRLRTPLTSVVGFSEILREGDSGLTEMDRRELMSTIAVQAIELEHLFDNLLTVSRGTGRATFIPARIALAAEIDAVLDTLEPARRAKVSVVAVDRDLVAAGDRGLVRQILRNLIANATDHGHTVELATHTDKHLGRVTVRDDGPGIPDDRVGSVFELYDHSDGHGQPQSMGVGLFVSRRLARRMSGELAYRRSGSWTVFELTLPALPAAVNGSGAMTANLETVN